MCVNVCVRGIKTKEGGKQVLQLQGKCTNIRQLILYNCKVHAKTGQDEEKAI